MRLRTLLTTALAGAACCLSATTAHAFCGFYVEGSGASLYNNATQVVLMRDGTRTVLSMQNNYQGPPENFAMVVPVPVVLQEEHVKTLPREVFHRIDQLAAPRLVEYWEQDPCAPQRKYDRMERRTKMARPSSAPVATGSKDLGVTVEAQFTVGEYQIVILSAKEATGLETWLGQEGYKIPAGSAPLLDPYVKGGSKFFVAKVDIKKVKFENGMAMLSPLRFHYDTNEFALPIRLGLVNAKDQQDLIVHILARGQRYEVANYPNAFIPTNLDVKDATRDRFAEFYAALFDKTLETNRGAVITEYSWDASSCDPCPTPALSSSELATLGMDVLSGAAIAIPSRPPSGGAPNPNMRRRPSRPPPRNFGGMVLTRLHARYGKADIKDDLVFRPGGPIVGGREMRTGTGGSLEEGAKPAGMNNFQARYAIRHEWTGPIECAEPRRGIWGGPPSGVAGSSKPTPAMDLAFAKRGAVQLSAMVASDIPELNVIAGVGAPPPETTDPAPAPTPVPPPQETKPNKKKGCQVSGGAPGWPALIIVLGLALALRPRRSGASR